MMANEPAKQLKAFYFDCPIATDKRDKPYFDVGFGGATFVEENDTLLFKSLKKLKKLIGNAVTMKIFLYRASDSDFDAYACSIIGSKQSREIHITVTGKTQFDLPHDKSDCWMLQASDLVDAFYLLLFIKKALHPTCSLVRKKSIQVNASLHNSTYSLIFENQDQREI